MSNVIIGDFSKPAHIDDMYSFPVSQTDNVIECDFSKRPFTSVMVDTILNDSVKTYENPTAPLYLYAEYLSKMGFDDDDVYTVIEAIVEPSWMQYADKVVHSLVMSYNDYMEMC